ncbi:MAG: cysteine desulfurase family protein [Armatimonadota bacterium]|nr:cysteine desulfurase family protein [Armatimonadota bacterium]MDR7474026.1 cysteine desulfurase family protein [Armatimonadota bacterium]
MPRAVYLDYASTTPLDPRVAEAMEPFFRKRFGNPSSVHTFGQSARQAVDAARETVARAVGADDPEEIVFTSGATEADNFALIGAAYAGEPRGRHLVVSAVEHHAVLEPARFLASRGFELTVVPVDGTGRVDPDAVRRAIRPQTILVSVMHSNNEIGTLQPVAEIGRITREAGVLLHCDAAQSAGIVPVNVQALGVDLLSLSAHKRYGPKGVGALYIRKGTPLVRLLHGGAHEGNRRAGTPNVPGIVGFAAALRLALQEMDAEAARLRALRDRMIAGLLTLDGVRLNGHARERLPGNVNVSFRGADSESLLLALDLQGVAASSGAACTSGSLEPSHVLAAIGLDAETAAGTLRFSLGRWTSAEEIDYVLEILPGILQQVRSALVR